MTKDDIRSVVSAIDRIADSVCEDGIPWTTPDGGSVGSVTEALIYVGESLLKIADGLHEVADAIMDPKR